MACELAGIVSTRRSRRSARRLARGLGLPAETFMKLLEGWAGKPAVHAWLAAGGRKDEAPPFVLAEIAEAQRRSPPFTR